MSCFLMRREVLWMPLSGNSTSAGLGYEGPLPLISLGNSLHFPMVHFATPNGEWLTSYGYQKMAGLLNSGKSGHT
jgi:hypothetical protein